MTCPSLADRPRGAGAVPRLARSLLAMALVGALSSGSLARPHDWSSRRDAVRVEEHLRRYLRARNLRTHVSVRGLSGDGVEAVVHVISEQHAVAHPEAAERRLRHELEARALADLPPSIARRFTTTSKIRLLDRDAFDLRAPDPWSEAHLRGIAHDLIRDATAQGLALQRFRLTFDASGAPRLAVLLRSTSPHQEDARRARTRLLRRLLRQGLTFDHVTVIAAGIGERAPEVDHDHDEHGHHDDHGHHEAHEHHGDHDDHGHHDEHDHAEAPPKVVDRATAEAAWDAF